MPPKRSKTGTSVLKTNKKAKTIAEEGEQLKESLVLSISSIHNLSQEITSESKYNNFVLLLEQLQQVGTQLLLKPTENLESESLGRQVALVLYKCFQTLAKEGRLTIRKNQDQKEKLVTKWLLDKLQSFKSNIVQILTYNYQHELSLQLDLLEIYLNLLKMENLHIFVDKQFPVDSFTGLITALFENQNGKILPDGLSDNYLILEFADTMAKYWDLQYYFFHALSGFLETQKLSKTKMELQVFVSKFLTIIKDGLLFNEKGTELENQPTWIPKDNLPSVVYKHNQFKSLFQKCILTIFSYPLLPSQYKATLLILHKRIIPYMAKPQSLMDFLTDSYDIQDDLIVPILALNSLYELIKTYNIEYPDFYTKLYSLLKPELLYTRYRSRFFRLCDLFLSSTHLSASLVASFIKKLARLSLTASAPGVVIVIPFIYNLLKRHPTCMVMLHNTTTNDDKNGYKDPFDALEVNPLATNAINSSLWEMETLMSHYHPNIATLAKIFGEPFRKPSYNMEDFLDWNYQSLLETEKSRKYKNQATALEYEEFDNVLSNNDIDGQKRVLLEGWTI